MKSEIFLKISERTSFANGHVFEKTGPFERIKGRVQYAVNPKDDDFSGITDLNQAPRNEKGLFDYLTDFLILKPEKQNEKT